MAYKKIVTPDRNLQFIQDNVANALGPLQAIPMIGGKVIAPTPNVLQGPPGQGGVLIDTAITAIAHGLNRVPSYWILLGIDRNATVFNAAGKQFDNKYIYLQASSACYAALWVS